MEGCNQAGRPSLPHSHVRRGLMGRGRVQVSALELELVGECPTQDYPLQVCT